MHRQDQLMIKYIVDFWIDGGGHQGEAREKNCDDLCGWRGNSDRSTYNTEVEILDVV